VEAFVTIVMKAILTLLLNMSPRRLEVDPVLVDVPPQLPSLEASGLRRSHRQALDPISVVKLAK
jgi:hypothetical protein